MKTQILPTSSAEQRAHAVVMAVRMLRQGAAIALPTETVYGLAADALTTDAALKIFEAKERPRWDPLIVHLPDFEWLDRVAEIASSQRQIVTTLVERFWPGPLTLLLRRRSIVPDVTTAGLDTVAVRMSANAVFDEIVRAFDSPLAAPSANRFGRISPTTAEHVAAELSERIPLIVDGGPTAHGVESTIVRIRDDGLEVMRLGPITIEELEECATVRVASSSGSIEAPGQSASHYAPRTPLVIANDLRAFPLPPGQRVGALSWRGVDHNRFAEVRVLSASGDLREAAANLFRCLRQLDEAGVDLIVAERIPASGLGAAIMDRLRRAASR